MPPIRILLADDHSILREGLRMLLDRQSEFEVVGDASNGREAVEMAGSLEPDVVIMDLAMPGLNGIEATRRIISRNAHTAVVILSMHSDESYILRSLKAGARAFLLKDSLKSDLIDAIRAAVQGKSFFSPKVSQVLKEDYVNELEARGSEDTWELLTDREREILQLVAEGKTNKEIANELNISPYTIDTHRSHILQKLNLHSAPELILYAVRKGIIS
ncbi:MAG TPA: response regulator transcription factor [Bryobacteraceae bacterium]|nr:response regulator transcription factor [Bryobacteraceae bacterium]